MDSSAASRAIAKRSTDDLSLMPPPPVKKIKRPPKVLDEDDYTDALSDIIARDYFPGLRESRAQNEYLSALESNNPAWIAEAARNLRAASDPKAGRSQRIARDGRFDEARSMPQMPPRAADTPRGYDGSSTPMSVAGSEASSIPETQRIGTSKHTLTSFQAKYTSEDNASFNDVLDKQNKVRREKHAYHWTNDGRIPTARQIASHAQAQRLLTDSADNDRPVTQHTETALVQRPAWPANTDQDSTVPPLSVGATASRPAKPDAWKITRPDNTFMFFADSIDDTSPSLPTIADQKAAASKAGPKETIHANTRFPPLTTVESSSSDGPIPPSPSLNTDIIAARGTRSDLHSTPSEYTGLETPRVNGYAFVDEDEPEPEPTTAPSYRDLLAGQAPDATPNPFKLSAMQKREALHHRLVEKTAAGKRAKEKDATPVRGGLGTPRRDGAGNMTPAAKRLMERLGRTPVRGAGPGGKEGRVRASDMWTPVRTPRRKVVG